MMGASGWLCACSRGLGIRVSIRQGCSLTLYLATVPGVRLSRSLKLNPASVPYIDFRSLFQAARSSLALMRPVCKCGMHTFNPSSACSRPTHASQWQQPLPLLLARPCRSAPTAVLPRVPIQTGLGCSIQTVHFRPEAGFGIARPQGYKKMPRSTRIGLDARCKRLRTVHPSTTHTHMLV